MQRFSCVQKYSAFCFASWVFYRIPQTPNLPGTPSVEKVIIASLNVALPWQATNMWQTWLCLKWKEKQVTRRTCLQCGVLKVWVSGENIFILILAMVNKEQGESNKARGIPSTCTYTLNHCHQNTTFYLRIPFPNIFFLSKSHMTLLCAVLCGLKLSEAFPVFLTLSKCMHVEGRVKTTIGHSPVLLCASKMQKVQRQHPNLFIPWTD